MRVTTDAIYIDDSGFGKECFIWTGIYIPAPVLAMAEYSMQRWRRDLEHHYGIPPEYELHATKFANNRGRPSDKTIYASTRTKIFHQCLTLIAEIPESKLLNTCSTRDKSIIAFGRLLNRINRAAQAHSGRVKVFCDKGKETELERIFNQLKAANHIPSRLGGWSGGAFTKNIPLDRIESEITFLDSRENHFIQAADFCAYAMLRWQATNMPNRERYNLHEAYRIIEPIFERRAFRSDPHGIIRA